jgi:hypothetical protein
MSVSKYKESEKKMNEGKENARKVTVLIFPSHTGD